MDIILDKGGKRLDVFLAKRLNLSRSKIAYLIKKGRIKIDGNITKPHHKTRKGWKISIQGEDETIQPEDMPLNILYEDSDIIVVDKPAGQITHPTGKIREHTLVNALLFHCPSIASCGNPERPGIVHRLDKDTSGLLVVAKTEKSFEALSRMIKERIVKRKYLALVLKQVIPDKGEIVKPIGRPRKGGVLMRVGGRCLKDAKTFYRVLERFNDASLLEIELLTGRTHQIRVHLASIQHPVLSDKRYGKHEKENSFLPIKRQALHAYSLRFPHPVTNKPLSFFSPLPFDMKMAIEILKNYG